MAYGRFINDVDVREGRKVCVIGKRVYESLFNPGEDPCGKYVRVDGIYYQVIGMCVSEGNINIQGRASEAVVLPFSTMQQAYNMGKRIDVICYTVKPGKKVSDLEPEIESILKEAHYIAPDDKQAVMKLNAEAMFSMMDNLFTGIHVLIWMVGLGTFAGRRHRCIEHHDGNGKGTNHGNRYTTCHRCPSQRYSATDLIGKYGTDYHSRHGRHLFWSIDPTIDGNRR